ncbi:cytochrome [Glutamicibacter halophytocola]|uniref:Cytochrome n=2 Tax=Glutamicibacter halophytocola TaxID=1933880 RepID=A0ABX5YE95_9MICC|nr:cytochrome [Glutamicibacter halophytocola]
MYSRKVGGEAIVPSITTVIGMDNMDLSGWAGYMAAKSLSEDHRLAQALGDARQLRSLVRDSASAAEAYRDQAAARGDRVHNYAEARALQALGQGHDLAEARAALEANNELAYAQHFETWWTDYNVEPLAAEVTVWNDSVGYAGTIDLVAKIGGRTCIVDYKTKTSDRDGVVKRPDDKVIMQLAAACKAEEQVVDAESGEWKPWEFGTDTMLLAVALGDTGTRTFMAPAPALPDYWAKFYALRRNWEATHKISQARATLAEITPPAR